MNDISIIYIAFGLLAFLCLGALLGEVAVRLAKMFGFDFDDEVNVDFMDRLNNGEQLSADNMFEIKND
jgi:hypothetical protein